MILISSSGKMELETEVKYFTFMCSYLMMELDGIRLVFWGELLSR